MKIMLRAFLMAGVTGMYMYTAQAAIVTSARPLTPQQQRMTSCNQQATAKILKGDERKTYMSNCLKNSSSPSNGKNLTPQQQKMGTCNAEASKKALKGDTRKTFMSDCLKKK